MSTPELGLAGVPEVEKKMYRNTMQVAGRCWENPRKDEKSSRNCDSLGIHNVALGEQQNRPQRHLRSFQFLNSTPSSMRTSVP